MRAYLRMGLILGLLLLAGCGGGSTIGGGASPSSAEVSAAAKGEALHTEPATVPSGTAAPEPITENSSCQDYRRGSKKEREDVGQVAVFKEATHIFVEGDCERHPTEKVRFAYCEVIEALAGIARGISGGEGLSAGERAELRERYPWCF